MDLDKGEEKKEEGGRESEGGGVGGWVWTQAKGTVEGGGAFTKLRKNSAGLASSGTGLPSEAQ